MVRARAALAVRSQLRDQAVAHVRELIAVGQAPPGSHLRLDALASTVGVSVTPVREALLLLAQDGIVVQEPNRGFRVAPIRRRDIEDTYLVYSKISGELAARASCRLDGPTIAHLRMLDERLRLLPPQEVERIEHANYALHDVVERAAGSPRLSLLVRAAERFVPRRYWAVVPGWLEWNSTAHTRLLDSLAQGDAEGAQEAMEDHVLSAARLLIAHFDAQSLYAEDDVV